jgi:hypothetical protein
MGLGLLGILPGYPYEEPNLSTTAPSIDPTRGLSAKVARP